MRKVLLASVILSSLLIACGQNAPTAETSTPANSAASYASRPELQDAGSQAILARYANDPGLLQALQEAYGERSAALSLPTAPALSGLDLISDRLAYIKRIGWGSIANYNSHYAAYAFTGLPYAGLDWTRDGCSAPSGLGLGYTEDFRPACNVHDFGYRNLKVYERTETNRDTTDDAFYVNMKSICNAKSWYKQPACYAAAYAYYEAVSLGGSGSF